MCRTGEVFRKCECGADITCIYEFLCRDCYAHWLDVEDSEVPS